VHPAEEMGVAVPTLRQECDRRVGEGDAWGLSFFVLEPGNSICFFSRLISDHRRLPISARRDGISINNLRMRV
jgi:hypothetical protein